MYWYSFLLLSTFLHRPSIKIHQKNVVFVTVTNADNDYTDIYVETNNKSGKYIQANFLGGKLRGFKGLREVI